MRVVRHRYTQMVMEEMTKGEGAKKGGKNVNIRYAAEKKIIADSKNRLQKLVNTIVQKCGRMGLRINKEKLDVPGRTKKYEILAVPISIQDTALNQVEIVQIPRKFGEQRWLIPYRNT